MLFTNIFLIAQLRLIFLLATNGTYQEYLIVNKFIVDSSRLYKVVHLVPCDVIGGVESAASTMVSLQSEKIDFNVEYLYKKIPQAKGINAFYNLFLLLPAVWRLHSLKPDILIVSLWRSSLVGVLVKLLRPGIKLVTFIHSERDVHLLDYFFTRASMLLSHQIWADSEATIKGRLSPAQRGRSRVISFVCRRFEALPLPILQPTFIFWGRITHQKGLDRAIRLFAEVYKKRPEARFMIVGPDGGVLSDLKKLCWELDLADSVTFLGAASHDQIVRYAAQAFFYLQTSLLEGMAMSVVEAMQMGLVPVVTPVGEIASYSEDGRNAVIVESDDKAVEDILSLLGSNERYQALRTSAIQTWKDKPLYRESVLEACQMLIKGDLSLKKRVR